MLNAKRALTLLAAVAALCGIGVAASAKTIRFSQQGDKAFVFELPKGWETDTQKGEMMMLIGPGAEQPVAKDRMAHRPMVLLTILADARSLDEVAQSLVVHSEAHKVGPATISGYPGFRYAASVLDARSDMVIVRVDPGHIAACDVLTPLSLTPSDAATAERLADAVMIFPAASKR